MPFRKILLRTLLGSLGAAAALGAVGVLSSGFEAVWRVIATALLTAGAAMLMLGASMMVDRPRTRPAGLLGMAFVVVEYLLILPLIWFDAGDRLALTAAFVAAPIVPAMLCLPMTRSRGTAAAGWTGLGACGAVCALMLVGLWSNRRAWDEDTCYEIAGAVALFAPLAVLCLIGLGTDRRHWRWVGVAASVVAAGGMVRAIIDRPHGGEVAFAVLVSAAVVVAHANLAVRVPLGPSHGWIRIGTLLATLATAVFVDLVVYVHSREWHDRSVYERLAGAAAIVAGCGSLALLVLARINRRVERPVVALETIREVTLVCPACHKKQTLPVGTAQCGGCNLVIHTTFEEPRCPTCDYSLLMLASDRCPECGTVVARGASPVAEATPPRIPPVS